MRETIYLKLCEEAEDSQFASLAYRSEVNTKWGESVMINFTALSSAVMGNWLAAKLGVRYDPLRRFETDDVK